jgi:PAS domain S-box-containing protein
LTALAVVLLGVAALIRERASRVSVAFVFIELAVSFWLCGAALMYCARDEAVAVWWARLRYLGIPFIPSTIYLFSAVAMGIYARRKRLIWAALLLSALFSVAAIGSDVLVTSVHRYWWGYYPRHGWLGIPLLVFFLGLVLANLRDYWVEYRKAAPGTHKLRLRALFAAFGIAYLASFDYLPCYGVPLYPFGYLPVFVCLGLMACAIQRYRLVDIVPAFAANEIIATMADPLAVCDADGRIRVVNQALCATLGYTEQELLGEPIEHLAGADAVGVERLRRLLWSGTARNEETVLHTQTGEPVPVSISLSPLQDGRRTRLGTVFVARDVREQQRAEVALRESEEKYRTILANIEDGYYEVDLAGNFTFFNDSLCRALGYSTDELMGMNYRRYTGPEKLATLYEVFNRVYRTGVPQRLFDWGITCKDGTKRIVETSVSLIRDGAGLVRGFRGVVRDVTEHKQAEEKVAESEARYRQLVELSPEAIVVHREGRILFANRAAAHMAGAKSAAEILGRPVVDFVHPDDRAQAVQRLQLSLATGTPAPVAEQKFVGLDGAVIKAEIRSQFVAWEGKQAVQVLLHDITERKRAEAEQAALLEIAKDIAGVTDLQELLDRVQQRIATVLPCDRIITYYWDATRSTYRALAWHGVPPRLVSDGVALEFHADQPVAKRLLAGETVLINDIAEQNLVPLELFTHFGLTTALVVPFVVRGRRMGALAAHHADNGRRFAPHQARLLEGIAQQVGVAIGAAELARALEEDAAVAGALAHVGQQLIASLSSPALLNQLCQLTTDVLGCDHSGTWLWDAREEAFVPVASSDDSPEQWEIARLVKLGRPELAMELAEMERDGIFKTQVADPPTSRANTLACARGMAVGLMVPLRRGNKLVGFHTADYRDGDEALGERHERIARGISQLASLALENVRLFEELERANSLKSDFVATMSHELRTPLNIFMGYNALLLEGGFGPLTEEQVDTLQRMEKSAQGLLELITATLDVSRLDSGQMRPAVQAIAWPDLIGELDAEISGLRGRPAVDLRWDLGPELPQLYSDPVKVKVVLKNLIGNALKFTDAGAVVVRLRTRDGGVETTVADTGVGIAREMLPVIFEPFRRSEPAMTHQHGGVGLGLYIVRRLLDILGGTIEVESTVGQGSTFRVWVPNLAHGNATLAAVNN